MRISSPSRTDPVARVASAVAGGPAGRRLAASTGFWRAVPVLVLLATLTMGLAVVQKNHCRTSGWSTPDQFWHACYSDIPVLQMSQGLGGAGGPSLLDAVGEGGLGQPPLPGALMWLVATVTSAIGGGASDQGPRQFFDVSAVLLTAVLLLTVVVVASTAGRRRSWDAAHVAISPVLLTAALLSYELVAVALVALTLWAWSRRQTVATGVYLGLAICSRPLTAMLAFALLGVCLRAGRLRVWIAAVAMAAGVWVAVRLVLFPAPLAALDETWQAWKASPPGYGSLWLVPQLLAQSKPASASFWYSGPAVSGSVSSMITLLGLALVAGATVLLALSARHRPRTAHLALFVMASSLLVTKSFPVQAALLLLPLVALAALRWRDHLLWAGAELVHFVAVWLFIAASSEANRGLPAGFYALLVLLRVAATGWLAARAVRLARDPTRDPVRVPVDPVELPVDDDDPGGGVVDDAPDALVVRLR